MSFFKSEISNSIENKTAGLIYTGKVIETYVL